MEGVSVGMYWSLLLTLILVFVRPSLPAMYSLQPAIILQRLGLFSFPFFFSFFFFPFFSLFSFFFFWEIARAPPWGFHPRYLPWVPQRGSHPRIFFLFHFFIFPETSGAPPWGFHRHCLPWAPQRGFHPRIFLFPVFSLFFWWSRCGWNRGIALLHY